MDELKGPTHPILASCRMIIDWDLSRVSNERTGLNMTDTNASQSHVTVSHRTVQAQAIGA